MENTTPFPNSSLVPISDGATAAPSSPAPEGASANGPAPQVLSEAEFQRKNQRRIDLIRKDTREGLTPEEQCERERLEEEMDAYAQVKFSGIDAMLDRMEERACGLGYVP